VILDKGDDLGGTWHDNQYPGCACDVPSPLYSYSFELNPSWTRIFAPQQEIWDYLRTCVRKHGLDEHIRYGCAVERVDWDDGGCAGPYGAKAAATAGTSTPTASTGPCGRDSPSSTGRAPAGLGAPPTP